MKKVSNGLQVFLKILIIFLLSFIWARYFIKPLWLAFIISISITIFIEIISHVFSKNRGKKKAIKAKEKEEAENISLSLISSKRGGDFLYNLFSSIYICEKKKDYIIITKEPGNEIVYPFNSITPLTENDLLQISYSVRKTSPNKVIVLCDKVSADAINFSKNISMEIIIWDKYETYKRIYKKYDTYPEITEKYKKSGKATFKELISYSFNNSRTKGYLFSAIILLLSSFFVGANIYYCIITSILVLFAMISFANPFGKEEDFFL